MLDFTNFKCKRDRSKTRTSFIELSQNKLAIRGIEVSFDSLEDNLKAIKIKKML